MQHGGGRQLLITTNNGLVCFLRCASAADCEAWVSAIEVSTYTSTAPAHCSPLPINKHSPTEEHPQIFLVTFCTLLPVCWHLSSASHLAELGKACIPLSWMSGHV